MGQSMPEATVNGHSSNGITNDYGSNILDIRSDVAGIALKQQITDGLKVGDNEEKTLPTMLLYDEQGLRLFEKITYLDEYYLTASEIELLQNHADRIAFRVPDGSMMVELGSGNLRKIKLLLDALERQEKKVTYYALDLMKPELERTLSAVPHGTFKHVKCFGLWGTYDDGLHWLQQPEQASRRKAVLSLGSSIGNFERTDAVEFLRSFAGILQPADMFGIGIDACQDSDRVYHAYNDGEGLTHEFILNGLEHANRLLGFQAFDKTKWTVIGEYDQAAGCHQAFVSPLEDVTVDGVLVTRGERVRIERSYKYNSVQASELYNGAGLRESAFWTESTGLYGFHFLQRPKDPFATNPIKYASQPIPSLEEWSQLWSKWDTVTRQMIPAQRLGEKPIHLRNPYIFYLGHIPTFLDMKLVEVTDLTLTDPKYFSQIFERGIDPDVNDPTSCHAHSEIPDQWPDLQAISAYQKDIRRRVQGLYENGQAHKNAWTGRALWLGFEHEVMHLETLLYIAIQSKATLPPADTVTPDFEQLATRARRTTKDNEWFAIPEQTVTIGLDDLDESDGPTRHFGWDVEKPAYTTRVPAFKAQARPITNSEYAQYLQESDDETIPASWMSTQTDKKTNGINGTHNGNAADIFVENYAVRTVYGPVPLKYALHWPVSASYDELQSCAKYMGGRIPTMEEARSIYEYAAQLKQKEAGKTLSKTIPAVNGHLSNEGVQESPPSNDIPLSRSSSTNAVQNPSELYADLRDANIGFANWHPVAVTPRGNRLAGQGEMGGLWEWTSTVLRRREGFEAMKLYPAYSADFYDGKHNIVLGGSWATHPRIAGRKTFVNWYQRNYPYVWATARLVKDL